MFEASQKMPTKKEVNLKLMDKNVTEYQRMLNMLFRRYGPSKSKIDFRVEKKTAYPFVIGIDPHTWDVGLTIRNGLEFKKNPELLKYMEKNNITDAIGEMIRKTGIHEMGHWEFPKGMKFGCPYDKPTYYTSFIEPIYDEVSRKGVSTPKKLSKRIANAVTDIIDNYNAKKRLEEMNENFAGQILFWYLQGQENGTYSKEYTFFVKLNLALFGNKDDIALLEKFFAKDPEIDKAVDRLKDIFTEELIYNKDYWEVLAREYTKEVLKFISPNEKPKHQYSASDKSSSPQKNKKKDENEDEEETGKEGKDKEEGEDSEGSEEDEKGAGKGEESEEETGKEGEDEEELGKDLSKEDIEKIMMERKAGHGIPFYIKTEAALDAYYRGLAKKIKFKAKGEMPSASYPLVPMNCEPFDKERHSPWDAMINKLHFNPVERKLALSVPKIMLPVDIPIRKEHRNMPEFIFTIIDSSESMMGGGDTSIVPWGDKSYYHYGLLVYFSINRFFEMEKIQIKKAAAIFSDITLAKEGEEEIKKLLFNPATGGTSLDMKKIMNVMRGKKNAVIGLITDGEIDNWDSIKDEFIRLAKKNQFFMIQIGGKSKAYNDLAEAGCEVKQVNSYEEIVQLAIDLTTQKYYGALRKDAEKDVKKYRELNNKTY